MNVNAICDTLAHYVSSSKVNVLLHYFNDNKYEHIDIVSDLNQPTNQSSIYKFCCVQLNDITAFDILRAIVLKKHSSSQDNNFGNHVVVWSKYDEILLHKNNQNLCDEKIQENIEQETEQHIAQFSLMELDSFREILNDKGSITIPESTHEFNQIFHETFPETEPCNHYECSGVEDCGCITRLMSIFSQFNQFPHTDGITICKALFEETEGYTLCNFLNDADHSIQYHSKCIQEGLFKKKTATCSLETFDLHKNDDHNIEDQTKYSLFREIYDYFVQPMDFDSRKRGIRSRRYIGFNGLNHVVDDTDVVDKNIVENAVADNNFESKCADSENDNKFEIKFEEHNDKDSGEENAKLPLIAIGHRFEYVEWSNGHENPYYVKPKYNDLKAEFVNNAQHNFSIKKWDILVAVSYCLEKKKSAKRLVRRKSISGNVTNIRGPISFHEVLSLKAYTDYDMLTCELCKTYNENYFGYKKAKQKHSHYALWANLLQNTCDVFGLDADSKDMFFRGLSQTYIFTSLHCVMHGPWSTSIIAAVAWSFAFGGIVLQLQNLNQYNTTRYVNMVLFSAFKNEQERLFFSNYNQFDVVSIHRHLSKVIINTSQILILETLTKKNKVDIQLLVKRRSNITSFSLLFNKYVKHSHQYVSESDKYLLDTIHHYVSTVKILHLRCFILEHLLIASKNTNQLNECKQLLNYFIDDVDLIQSNKCLHFNLYKLIKIFPMVQTVLLDFTNCSLKLNKDNKSWDNLIVYMGNDSDDYGIAKLKRVEIRNLSKKYFPKGNFLSDIQTKISYSPWNIYKGTHIRTHKQSILFLQGKGINSNYRKTFKHSYKYELVPVRSKKDWKQNLNTLTKWARKKLENTPESDSEPSYSSRSESYSHEIKNNYAKTLPAHAPVLSPTIEDILFKSTTVSSNKPENTHCEISNCLCLQQFSETMKKYNNSFGNQNINILSVLNNFLHLLENHNDDDQFEIISDMLPKCNCTETAKCAAFQRNYRNRVKLTDDNKKRDSIYKHNSQNVLTCQILDKIHCYYMHSYDIGIKLKHAEKLSLQHVAYDDESKNDLTNEKIKCFHQILSEKNKATVIQTRLKTKFNSLSMQSTTYQSQKLFRFGVEFEYGYPNEIILNGDQYIPVNKLLVYKNVKEELLSNGICRLSVQQFDSEYAKATLHHSSEHRKQQYPNLTTEQIFALIIYANFDKLQFLFSKSYRENTKDHHNFYHLGKLLKMAIHNNGTSVTEGKIGLFYHGIGEQLVFPDLIGSNGQGIYIFCPLSTSSSLTVATNFTNCNQGLIVQFDGAHSEAKYFSLSWLSDYPNESECLFIDNQAPLQISNIINALLGVEYNSIILPLKTMDTMLRGKRVDNFSNATCMLVACLFNYQLPSDMRAENSCQGSLLDSYAKKIVNVYCNNKKQIVVDCEDINIQKNSNLKQLFCHQKYKWIKLNTINALFPNVENVVVRNVDLCSTVFDEAFKHLNKNLKLNEIKILPNIDSQSSISKAINKYQKMFKTINVILSLDEYHNWLCLRKE
eukprot:295782_1